MDFAQADIKKILVTARLSADALAHLEKMAEVIYEPWTNGKEVKICGAEETASRIKEVEADIFICESDLCSGPVFESGVKIIATGRETPQNIDLVGAKEAGIPVLYTPGRTADAVAEHTLALLFALNQRVFEISEEVKSGKVVPAGSSKFYNQYRHEELAGKFFGIVGLNEVGRSIKWRVEALGLETLVCDPYNPEAQASLEDVIQNSHIISLHAPAIEETCDLMGKVEFDKCRSGTIYLNTVGDYLQDTDALVQALRSGRIAAAGLDYSEVAKFPVSHPLLKMQNVILTPQIGGLTPNSEARQGQMIVNDLFALLNGKLPIHIANPTVLEISAEISQPADALLDPDTVGNTVDTDSIVVEAQELLEDHSLRQKFVEDNPIVQPNA